MKQVQQAFPEGVTIPRDSRLERIESSYGPLETAVPCGLCGTPHKRGYIVAFSLVGSDTLETGILGHVCGKREFKETWTQEVNRHEAEIRAAEIRAELVRFLENAGDAEARLQASIPKLEIYSAIKEILLIDARDFMRYCESACKSRNGLLEAFGYDGQRTKHQLEGKSFFTDSSTVGTAKRLLTGIEQIRRAAEQPEMTARQIKELLSRLGNLRLSVEEIEKQTAEWAVALRPTNFRKAIRTLANYEAGDRIQMNGTVLEVSRVMFSAEWIVITDLANPTMPEKFNLLSW